MGSMGDANAVLGAEEVEEGVEAMAGVQEVSVPAHSGALRALAFLQSL